MRCGKSKSIILWTYLIDNLCYPHIQILVLVSKLGPILKIFNVVSSNYLVIICRLIVLFYFLFSLVLVRQSTRSHFWLVRNFYTLLVNKVRLGYFKQSPVCHFHLKLFASTWCRLLKSSLKCFKLISSGSRSVNLLAKTAAPMVLTLYLTSTKLILLVAAKIS